MTLDECRRFFAEEIRFVANVRSNALVEAFACVQREHFLGPGPWEIGTADRGLSASGTVEIAYTRVDDPRHVYHNVVVLLDRTADIHNGQPSFLACCIDALDLKPGERAYHLGCGVGYYTAIIAEVVGQNGSVAASEVNADLARRAQENLRDYPNVSVHSGDGATFDPGECDAILVNAGVTHPLPLWMDRLRDAARMVFPLTMAVSATRGMGLMIRIVRHGRGFSAEIVTPVGIYSATGVRDPEREPLLKTAMTTGIIRKLKSARRDVHDRNDTCIVHGPDVCLTSVAVT